MKPALWRPLVAIIQHPDSTEPEKGMQIGKSRGGGGGGGGGVALPFNRRGLPPGGAVLFCFLNIVAVLALAFVLMFGNEQCSVEPTDLLKTGGGVRGAGGVKYIKHPTDWPTLNILQFEKPVSFTQQQ